MYHQAHGVIKDEMKAIEYYMVPIDNGCTISIPPAVELFQKRKMDKKKIFELQLYSSFKKEATGHSAIASFYEKGVAVGEDLEKAAQFYLKLDVGSDGFNKGLDLMREKKVAWKPHFNLVWPSKEGNGSVSFHMQTLTLLLVSKNRNISEAKFMVKGIALSIISFLASSLAPLKKKKRMIQKMFVGVLKVFFLKDFIDKVTSASLFCWKE